MNQQPVTLPAGMDLLLGESQGVPEGSFGRRLTLAIFTAMCTMTG
ncbi:hypothetical protein NZK35_12040 [Stieleria sp. ICT_E10.1]|nr:hypothetical protein [Stieleria sedimenti]MCS7467375.1 hypothetical protein [Stieleria sedimenti]